MRTVILVQVSRLPGSRMARSHSRLLVDTEINVISPTGIRELDCHCEMNIAGDLLQTIESLIQLRSG